MLNRIMVLIVGLMAVLTLSSSAFAQTARQSPTVGDQKPAPAPRHDISGTWTPANGPGGAIQAGGVAAMPNDGKPEHQLPYTPYGLETYKSHKALEGKDAVAPAFFNDPRDKCEPLGFPRMNHYNLRMTQILQDEFKVALMYEYDRRYRVVWTDGRDMPKLVDGGVQLGRGWGPDSGHVREQRFYGYSVGKWVDDTTLVVETVGTMPEDRVWLDSTGRPISDQIHVTETFHRVDHDHLEWTEMINDPKIYTKPWLTMNILMVLADLHTDVMEMYCSPVEMEKYYQSYGNAVSGVDSK
ncbi:MAG: hypothetical protein DMG31_03795 [Acidobacteria bacterium]|nr:MAG: hypothetical protein DMG31_03795 [Acidobacteriota bacterium]